MGYGQLIRFLLPLVLMVVVQEFGEQVLNAGMARMPRAVETLAGYGLAWGLTALLSGPLTQGRQLGLVLATHKQAYWQVSRFVLLTGLGLSGVVACLAITPFGAWVIEDVHRADASLAAVVGQAFVWLIPFPIFRGFARFYGGLLIQVRRTDVVSAGTIASIGMSIVTVFVLLSTDWVDQQPIMLPLLASYAGLLTEFAIVWWGQRRFVPLERNGDEYLSFMYIVKFFWPLALIMGVQAGTRPLINLFVSRASDGTEALAVLTIVYALGHVPYGWVNEVRSLPAAFKGEPGGQHYITRFVWGCGIVSFVSMLVLFWTPMNRYLLDTVIGVGPELAVHCETPLMIFLGFPFVVALRSYYHGVGLVAHKTQVMAPSAPSRIAAVVVMFVILSQFDMHTATRAVGALVSGHSVEALVVWWAVRKAIKEG